MSMLDKVTHIAGRFADDVQQSLRRARLEGERRVLQRHHRSALEVLGERAFDLVRSGKLPAGDLAPELANVEGKLMEIDAKSAEIEALRAGADGDGPPAPAGSGWEAADRYFRKS